MNGIHDVGGMHGFGPVERHDPALRFEYDWEPAVVAMQSALERTVVNIDEFRHAIERMDPLHYLGSTYFEHWLESFITTCREKGVVTAEELEARERSIREGIPPPPARPVEVRRKAEEGHPFRREATAPPLFTAGQRIRTRNFHPRGHTRLARYACGKPGTVVEHKGCFVFPDTNAHGLGECPQHLYGVRFEAADLWGESAEPGTCVYIDLFESYLEPLEA